MNTELGLVRVNRKTAEEYAKKILKTTEEKRESKKKDCIKHQMNKKGWFRAKTEEEAIKKYNNGFDVYPWDFGYSITLRAETILNAIKSLDDNITNILLTIETAAWLYKSNNAD